MSKPNRRRSERVSLRGKKKLDLFSLSFFSFSENPSGLVVLLYKWESR